jgi:hypothetical protein
VAQSERVRDRLAIDLGANDGGQPIGGGERIHILRDCAGRCRCKALAARDRNERHAAVIGDIDEIERRLVDEILIAGDPPHVAAGCKLQRVRDWILGIGARGQPDIDVRSPERAGSLADKASADAALGASLGLSRQAGSARAPATIPIAAAGFMLSTIVVGIRIVAPRSLVVS